MTVFARASNLALIFNLACSAAVRLISQRTLLSSRKKPIIPPSCTKCSNSPTVSTALASRFASVAGLTLLIGNAYQNLTALNLLRLSEVQHPERLLGIVLCEPRECLSLRLWTPLPPPRTVCTSGTESQCIYREQPICFQRVSSF